MERLEPPRASRVGEDRGTGVGGGGGLLALHDHHQLAKDMADQGTVVLVASGKLQLTQLTSVRTIFLEPERIKERLKEFQWSHSERIPHSS